VASYWNWRNQGGFDFDADPGHRDALDAEHVRIRRSYHPATISLLWRAQMNAAIKAQARWGEDRVFLQRYEDLVTGPDASLRWLSDRLGISFHEAMLSVPMHNSSYEQFERKHGISHKALARWQQQLDPEEVRVVQRICVHERARLYPRRRARRKPARRCAVGTLAACGRPGCRGEPR
jgi:hypothetical protein